MSVFVRQCHVAEIEQHADFSTLAREYAHEASIHGLPKPDEKLASYRVIDQSGFFQAYGAFFADHLIGFIAILTPVIPHYGVAVAVAESFFVAPLYRKRGAGLKLLRAAERHAAAAGSPGLLLSAPSSGRLMQVLPYLGYRETNRVFFKEIAHDRTNFARENHPRHERSGDPKGT